MPTVSKNFHHLATGLFTPVDRVALAMDQLLQKEASHQHTNGGIVRHSWMRGLEFFSVEKLQPCGNPVIPRLRRDITATHFGTPVLDYSFYFTQVGAIHMIHRSIQKYVPGDWEGLPQRRFTGPEPLAAAAQPLLPVRRSGINLA